MDTLTYERVNRNDKLIKFIYSSVDRGLVESRTWYLDSKGYAYGAFYTKGKKKNKALHRLIMDAAKGEFIDHKDGNPLNNTRSNLRKCTRQENSRNLRHKEGTKSGVKGVYEESDTGYWRARICISGELKHLGVFRIKEDAIKAREAAEIKYFGEFRRKK